MSDGIDLGTAVQGLWGKTVDYFAQYNKDHPTDNRAYIEKLGYDGLDYINNGLRDAKTTDPQKLAEATAQLSSQWQKQIDADTRLNADEKIAAINQIRPYLSKMTATYQGQANQLAMGNEYNMVRDNAVRGAMLSGDESMIDRSIDEMYKNGGYQIKAPRVVSALPNDATQEQIDAANAQEGWDTKDIKLQFSPGEEDIKAQKEAAHQQFYFQQVKTALADPSVDLNELLDAIPKSKMNETMQKTTTELVNGEIKTRTSNNNLGLQTFRSTTYDKATTAEATLKGAQIAIKAGQSFDVQSQKGAFDSLNSIIQDNSSQIEQANRMGKLVDPQWLKQLNEDGKYYKTVLDTYVNAAEKPLRRELTSEETQAVNDAKRRVLLNATQGTGLTAPMDPLVLYDSISKEFQKTYPEMSGFMNADVFGFTSPFVKGSSTKASNGPEQQAELAKIQFSISLTAGKNAEEKAQIDKVLNAISPAEAIAYYQSKKVPITPENLEEYYRTIYFGKDPMGLAFPELKAPRKGWDLNPMGSFYGVDGIGFIRDAAKDPTDKGPSGVPKYKEGLMALEKDANAYDFMNRQSQTKNVKIMESMASNAEDILRAGATSPEDKKFLSGATLGHSLSSGFQIVAQNKSLGETRTYTLENGNFIQTSSTKTGQATVQKKIPVLFSEDQMKTNLGGK
jgi:hypothetical protein